MPERIHLTVQIPELLLASALAAIIVGSVGN
jgi:hypothetical protein